MIVIRLTRIGRKNQPAFKIVALDKKNPPKGGRFLEILGFYNPLTKKYSINEKRVKYWLSVGAKPTNRIHNLLVSKGIIKAKKINLFKKKKKEEKNKPEEKKENKSEEKKEPEEKKEETKESKKD